jgi:hypothetical protein
MVVSKINCYPESSRPNNTLIKIGISYGLFVSLLEGDRIPLTLLYRIDVTSLSWACHRINTLQLANVAYITSATNTYLMVPQTLKQTTQYNKYYK